MKRQIRNGRNVSTVFAVICAIAWAALQAMPAQAQLTELYAFQYNSTTTSSYPDGQAPMAELIQGADGTTTRLQAGGARADVLACLKVKRRDAAQS